jgi:hypothetical protein
MTEDGNQPEGSTMTETAIRVTRRGFASRTSPVPAAIRENADKFIANLVATYARVEAVRASIRPAAYCGPGSEGGWMLELYVTHRDTYFTRGNDRQTDHFLEIIYDRSN